MGILFYPKFQGPASISPLATAPVLGHWAFRKDPSQLVVLARFSSCL